MGSVIAVSFMIPPVYTAYDACHSNITKCLRQKAITTSPISSSKMARL